MIEPDPVIECVDCGGRAYLLTHPRRAADEAGTSEDGAAWEPGDIVAYRCADCLDRWDLVLPDDPDERDE